jgi:hypothetical protein
MRNLFSPYQHHFVRGLLFRRSCVAAGSSGRDVQAPVGRSNHSNGFANPAPRGPTMFARIGVMRAFDGFSTHQASHIIGGSAN